MKRLLTTFILLAALTASLCAAGTPNIIFFLADDFGLDGVGCYGSDSFKTPNIDALAKSGLRFENAYCAPLCGPTRCLFITGRYAFRTGGLSNQTAGRPQPTEEPSIARTMKQAGYATCHVGKWRQMGATPGDWGFDEYITDPTAGGYYWKQSYTKNGKVVQTDKEIYYPDVTHAHALDFLTRNKDRPFFLSYASHLVHGPIVKTPDSKPGGNLYEDNVAYLDKQLGDLVTHVEKLGLREKTVIIFAADNGTARASRTIGGQPLSGQKASMLDCGAHVPFIASWKGTTPEGKVTKDLVDFTDLYATFAELAGTKPPAGVVFDGRSFAPQLHGQPGQPRDWIYVQLARKWYVREMDWKLNQDGELFDVRQVPFKETVVAAAGQSEAAAAARKRLQAVLDQLNPTGGKTEPIGLQKAAKKAAKAAKKKTQ